MDFNEYQRQAKETAIYDKAHYEGRGADGFVYLTLGACGEAGEIAEKVKKYIRGDFKELPKEEIALELGDLLWYLSEQARLLGYELSEIAEMNLAKLAERKKRGTLQGEGDKR